MFHFGTFSIATKTSGNQYWVRSLISLSTFPSFFPLKTAYNLKQNTDFWFEDRTKQFHAKNIALATKLETHYLHCSCPSDRHHLFPSLSGARGFRTRLRAGPLFVAPLTGWILLYKRNGCPSSWSNYLQGSNVLKCELFNLLPYLSLVQLSGKHSNAIPFV